MDRLHEVQYGNSSKYNARLFLHYKFGTNKYLWPIWVFDHFKKGENLRVLEIGCGNGLLWKANAGRIPAGWVLRLSDFSGGMLDAAKSNIGNSIPGVTYEVMDANAIPYESGTFDVVVANHMLYHIPDRNSALSEISRVLRPGGRLYATTMREDYMKEMKSMIAAYRGMPGAGSGRNSVIGSFSIENGREQLERFFDDIELRIYPNTLVVHEAGPFVEYAYSLGGMYGNRVVLEEKERGDFLEFVENTIKTHGGIVVPADAGLFICGNRAGGTTGTG